MGWVPVVLGNAALKIDEVEERLKELVVGKVSAELAEEIVA